MLSRAVPRCSVINMNIIILIEAMAPSSSGSTPAASIAVNSLLRRLFGPKQ